MSLESLERPESRPGLVDYGESGASGPHDGSLAGATDAAQHRGSGHVAVTHLEPFGAAFLRFVDVDLCDKEIERLC